MRTPYQNGQKQNVELMSSVMAAGKITGRPSDVVEDLHTRDIVQRAADDSIPPLMSETRVEEPSNDRCWKAKRCFCFAAQFVRRTAPFIF
mmetsp:Transcript_27777/g.40908  ORF Transcript_27777/g.40908 Transcript_27777/m.40908 type:complete len:90 (+) Transcript_27777:178-447(+)